MSARPVLPLGSLFVLPRTCDEHAPNTLDARPRLARPARIWLAARPLNQGRFFWPGVRHGSEVELDAEQLQALVLGLPWQRVGAGGIISML